jgi:type II secretory pathway pseudopilin PulG
MTSPVSPRGFTLVETLVATGVLITALAGVAQLFVLGTQLTKGASASGLALVAAQDKLEALRGLTFAYSGLGQPITDAALLPSPSSSLAENLPPYVDWIDASGQSRSDAENATLVRRWRITALPATIPDAVTIEVCVFQANAAGIDPASADACLSTLRTRQP